MSQAFEFGCKIGDVVHFPYALVELNDDGTVGGYLNDNERFFESENDNTIVLLDHKRNPTCVLHQRTEGIWTGAFLSNYLVTHYLRAVNFLGPAELRYVIASNSYNYETTVPPLIEKLRGQGILANHIRVCVSHHPKRPLPEDLKLIDGVTFSFVQYNSFELSALMDVYNSIYEYWFMMHDTVEPGPNFHRMASQLNITGRPDIVFAAMTADPTLVCGWHFMGAYRITFIRKLFSWLLQHDGKYDRASKFGIAMELGNENTLWRRAGMVCSYMPANPRETGETEYHGKKRKIHYLPGVDLKKFFTHPDTPHDNELKL
jgi:hypothetical protein